MKMNYRIYDLFLLEILIINTISILPQTQIGILPLEFYEKGPKSPLSDLNR